MNETSKYATLDDLVNRLCMVHAKMYAGTIKYDEARAMLKPLIERLASEVGSLRLKEDLGGAIDYPQSG